MLGLPKWRSLRPRSKKYVLLAIAVAVIAIVAYFPVSTYLGKGHSTQQLSVEISQLSGQGLPGVTVQGVMVTPPNLGVGFTTLFIGLTNESGGFAVNSSGIESTRTVAQDWVNYQGQPWADVSSPTILLLLTYPGSTGLYFEESTMPLNTSQILLGTSYEASLGFNLLAPPQTSWGNTLPAPPLNCTDLYFCYEWWASNTTYWPSPTSQGAIPLVWEQTLGGAYGEMAAQLAYYSGTGYNFNTGLAYSSDDFESATYMNGSTVWSSTLSNLTTPIENTNSSASAPNGFIGTYATVEGTEWGLAHRNVNTTQWQLTKVSQYDVAAVEIKSDSSGEVIYTKSQKTAPTLAMYNATMDAAFEYHFLGYGYGTGDVTPSQSLNSGTLVTDFSDSDYSWLTLGIDAGAIMASAAGLEGIAIPLGILSEVVATLSGRASSGGGTVWTASATMYWDAPSGYMWFAYAALSNISYDVGTSSFRVPLAGLYVVAVKPQSARGGCVLQGTLITTSDGSQVPVQEITPGTQIQSFNTTAFGLPGWGPITTTVLSNNESNVSDIISINNGWLYFSGPADQSLFVKFSNGTIGTTLLGELYYGMELYDPIHDEWVPITNISLIPGNFSVYDIELELGGQNSEAEPSLPYWDYVAGDLSSIVMTKGK